MNVATVVGTIWATRRHPNTEGLTLQLIRPEAADGAPFDEPIVAVDTMGAGVGERVFYVTALEAAIAVPERSEVVVDAAIVGIVEGIEESP